MGKTGRINRVYVCGCDAYTMQGKFFGCCCNAPSTEKAAKLARCKTLRGKCLQDMVDAGDLIVNIRTYGMGG